jgi:hypothetical protein
MGYFSKRFGNQSPEEILRHLTNLLHRDKVYTLCVDPMGIYFEIRESQRQLHDTSEKEMRIRQQTQHLPQRLRRLTSTRKRINPKIRTVKKGRTVNLKGVVY